MEEVPTAAADTDTVRRLIVSLGSLTRAVDDGERIERVRLFEELKSVAAAAQAVEARDFEVSQRAAQAAAGVPSARQGRGVAAQLALARRVSPWAAQRWLGWAGVLTRELPGTFAALQAGRISEWRATLMARETIWLCQEDRAQVDALLAPQLEGWGDRRVEAEAKKAAYRLDPQGFVDRARNAVKDRRVTMRPAPDTMAWLTALLPAAQAVAAYAALCRAADTSTAVGDERGRGQLMADTLVERVTGQASADAVPVEIELVMTDRTLLHPTTSDSRTSDPRTSDPRTSDPRTTGAGTSEADCREDAGSQEPAVLIGYGPIPAGLARDLALGTGTGTGTDTGPRWLRRLFLHPSTGQLAAMESRRRLFPESQRRFLRLRDQYCRTPWCGAPIRHTDHLRPAHTGGATSVANGAGLCAACNYAKQAAGWHTHPHPSGSILITTPTGHRYPSHPPDPPDTYPPRTGTGTPRHSDSPVEREFTVRLAAYLAAA